MQSVVGRTAPGPRTRVPRGAEVEGPHPPPLGPRTYHEEMTRKPRGVPSLRLLWPTVSVLLSGRTPTTGLAD